jgi:nucleotide-binding universal stress UspA family protein
MKFNKILIPINGSGVDEEMLQLAAGIVKKSKTKVYVIYVIEVKRALPLDADIEPEVERGEAVLARAENVAEKLELGIEAELLQAREVGPAIVDEAVERNVDAVLMGVPYRKRFGDFYLGKAVPYVLKHAPCHVWVVREPTNGVG